MATASKGRGRGHFFMESKPGSLPPNHPDRAKMASPMELLSILVSEMSVQVDELDVQPVVQTFKEAVTSTEQMNRAIEILFSRSFENWHCAPCAVHIFGLLTDINVDDKPFRSALLTSLQAVYKQKDDLRKERPPKKWLGCVSLLAQILSKLRLATGEPMKLLVNVSLESILLCLDDSSTDEELDCVANQLVFVGDIFSEHADQKKVEEILCSINRVVVQGRGHTSTRLKLIEDMERIYRNVPIY